MAMAPPRISRSALTDLVATSLTYLVATSLTDLVATSLTVDSLMQAAGRWLEAACARGEPRASTMLAKLIVEIGGEYEDVIAKLRTTLKVTLYCPTVHHNPIGTLATLIHPL
jgi:hypothetical protein